ncbi:MAG: class I SAM-dependent methyltransferase [Candidatus Ranarchaeia archaeon]|jgi:predicted O-methyltransferase YrrM
MPFDSIDYNLVSELYEKYAQDLQRVRKEQKELYLKMGGYRYEKYFVYRAMKFSLRKMGVRFVKEKRPPQLDDLVTEITYMLIREVKPKTIVEISPGIGWSSSWILQALKDNNIGHLYSFDLVDHVSKALPTTLTKERWTFTSGDVKTHLEKIPKNIDYLFMDSDHSGEFAEWYIKDVFPRVRDNVPVSVDDVYHTSEVKEEGLVVLSWLKDRNLAFFTPSPAKNKQVFDNLNQKRKELGIKGDIHFISKRNPTIFFIMKK